MLPANLHHQQQDEQNHRVANPSIPLILGLRGSSNTNVSTSKREIAPVIRHYSSHETDTSTLARNSVVAPKEVAPRSSFSAHMERYDAPKATGTEA
jgi:hypothetical protein